MPSNLVADDTDGVSDIFVKDLVGGSITRVSLLPGGGEADDASYNPSISDDGKKVVFTTDSDLFDEDNDFNFSPDVYVVNRDVSNDGFANEATDRSVTRVSVGEDGVEADFGGTDGVISGNGNWVAFTAVDSLVAADPNGSEDVYVRNTDPSDDATEDSVLISQGTTVSGGGGQLPAISSDRPLRGVRDERARPCGPERAECQGRRDHARP